MPAVTTPQFLRDLQFSFRLLKSKLPTAKFSNFGEQQIIDRYVEQFRIADASATVVDIGAGDGIRSSNTYHLFKKGWRGIGIEADKAKFRRLQTAYAGLANAATTAGLVSPSNVTEILHNHSIPHDFGLLSLDIDGNDYWVLDAILTDFRPRLVVSEYNEKIPPPLRFVVEMDPEFTLRHHFFGYSIAKLEDLLRKHDYVLLEVEYNNVFLTPRETAGAVGQAVKAAYDAGYANRADRREKLADNADMEFLQTASPQDAVEFLNRFYAEHVSKYQLDIGGTK